MASALTTAERLLQVATVAIDLVDPRSSAARSVIEQYVGELDDRFRSGFDPHDGGAGTDATALRRPGGAFLVMLSDHAPIGCGGLQRIDEHTGEIKRMWIHPDWRGLGLGRRLSARLEAARLVGLLLAFGMSMAVGRYESRRALVVQEANDIGTTYLRAQLLAEPESAQSMQLLAEYTDAVIVLANVVPDTESYQAAAANIEAVQTDLWTLAVDAVNADPIGTGPRLYVETLNNTFDTHTSRVASLGNRVPTPVMLLLVVGSAIAVGALAFYLTLLGKGLATSLITAVVVLIILFVSFDLDRPRRGFIKVPDTVLVQLRDSFDQP